MHRDVQMKARRTSNAVEILHRRYIKGDPERLAALERERVNADVALMIYGLREEAGLTQKELAELVDTTQSAISRLEDSDYDGHSLSMLNRIAIALNKRLTVVMETSEPGMDVLKYTFKALMQGLRRKKGLGIKQLAQKLDISCEEALMMERNEGYRPSPLTVHKLSKFYKIPERALATLAGAFGKCHKRFMTPHRVSLLSQSLSRNWRQRRRRC